MKVVVITPPTPVVTKDEAKRHLLVDHSDDDLLIETFILAATQWIDGPAGWLGRAIGVQVLEWQRCDWPRHDELFPYPPELEVVSVGYVDPDGVEQSWALPTPVVFENMPGVRGREGDVKIRYRAGYGALTQGENPVWENDAPAAIKVAILMLVAQWYATRAPVSIGEAVEALPFAVDALLSPYRVFR